MQADAVLMSAHVSSHNISARTATLRHDQSTNTVINIFDSFKFEVGLGFTNGVSLWCPDSHMAVHALLTVLRNLVACDTHARKTCIRVLPQAEPETGKPR